jgi:uncharacterized protein YndB with AHSA1/START domain
VNLPDTYEQFSGNGNRRKNTNFIGDNMLLAGNLQVTTSGDLEILITRDFNAPHALVWKAMSNSELIRKWLFGPPGWSMTTCEDDAREGGKFRWAWSGPEGVEMAMHGVYTEVVAPERMVRTETFEFGCEAHAGEQIATLTLAEDGASTHLTIVIKYPSKEARDSALASGMEQGMKAGYDRLEEMIDKGEIR